MEQPGCAAVHVGLGASGKGFVSFVGRIASSQDSGQGVLRVAAQRCCCIARARTQVPIEHLDADIGGGHVLSIFVWVGIILACHAALI